MISMKKDMGMRSELTTMNMKTSKILTTCNTWLLRKVVTTFLKLLDFTSKILSIKRMIVKCMLALIMRVSTRSIYMDGILKLT